MGVFIKNIAALFIAGLSVLLPVGCTFGDIKTADRIAAASPFVAREGAKLRITAKDSQEFEYLIASAVYEVFPACFVTDGGGNFCYDYDDKGDYYFSFSGIEVLEDCEAACEEWAASAAREAVADGMDRWKAAAACYDYMVSSFVYDSPALSDFETAMTEQGAYGLITTGKGLCASMSRAYLLLLGAVPVNGEGLADWENGKTGSIDVSLLMSFSPAHMLNAVTIDGTTLYIDVSEGTLGKPGYGRSLDAGTYRRVGQSEGDTVCT